MAQANPILQQVNYISTTSKHTYAMKKIKLFEISLNTNNKHVVF